MVTEQYIERLRMIARGHRLELPEQAAMDSETYAETIRSILNHEVYSRAMDWMVPRWVLDLRKSGQLDSSIPLLNTMSCTWMQIGGVGGRYTALCDETGLVMANPECGSLDFWLVDADGEIHFPTIDSLNGERLILESPEDQLFTWTQHVGPVEFTRHIYHGQDEDHEAVYNEIMITNKSLSDARLTFFAVVRPMSVRGVEPISKIEYVEDFDRIITNGSVALEMNRPPTSVIMTTADNPNLLNDALSMIERRDISYNTARGLATAILRFDVILHPAQSTTLYFIQPFNMDADSNVHISSNGVDIRAKSVERWFDFMDSTSTATFPDPSFNELFLMAKASIAMNARGSISPDSNLTTIEKARVLIALGQIGEFRLAESIATDLALQVSTNLRDGNLLDALILTCGILNLYEYSRDREYLSKISGVVDEVEVAIRDEMLSTIGTPKEPPKIPLPSESTHSVTPPPPIDTDLEAFDVVPDEVSLSEPEEEPSDSVVDGPDDSTTIADYILSRWVLLIGQLVVDVLEQLGDLSRVENLHSLWTKYSETLKDVPVFPDLGSIEDEDERLRWTLELFNAAMLLSAHPAHLETINECGLTIRSALMRKGLLKSFEREDVSSIFLTLRLAQIYALRNDSDTIESILQRVIRHASVDKVLPDEVGIRPSPQVRIGSTVRSAVDLILLLRRMIVADVEENLMVLGGIPEDWFVSDRDLIFSNIPTRLGRLEIAVGSSANQHQIDVHMDDLPRELEIHVPGLRGLKMFKVYGGSIVGRVDNPVSPHIRIIPLSDNVVVTYHK